MLKNSGSSIKLPPVFLGAAVAFGLYGSSLYSYLLFHSLVELFSVLVAFVIFVLAWHTRRLLDSHYLLFIGIASLCTGALDLVHILAYKGMGVFPGHDANLATQLWIAFRYVFSVSLLFAPFFVSRKLHPEKALAVFMAATAFLLASIFLRWFPDCFVEGSGLTRFKIVSEYVICLIFLAALATLLVKRRAFDRTVLQLMALSILSSVVSELCFTQYASVYGAANMAGHFFELLSYTLIYRAIVVTGVVEPSNLLFRDMKQREEALKESETRLKAIFEKSVDAIGVSKGGVHVFVNPAYLSLYGYGSNAELAGKPILDLIAPAERGKILEYVRSREKGGVVPSFYETRGIRKNGAEFIMDVHVSTYELSGEAYTLVIIRDITERKRAEKILWESKDRYRSLFENMLDGFAYCKMLYEHDQPYDFVYLDVNSAFERLTGLKHVIGKKVTEVIPGIRDSNPELFEIYGRVASTGKEERFELYLDPLHSWLSVSVYSTEWGYFVAVFDNITVRKQAEEALRKSHEKLEGRVRERTAELVRANEELETEIAGHKQAEEGISRLNRLYSVLSKVSEAIVRTHSPEKLYEKVCRIAVEDGQFKMAWIGLTDEGTQKVKPVASCGDAEGYLNEINVYAGDVSEGRGPTGRAACEGTYSICSDIERDPRMLPWRDRALRHGFRSSAAFPLRTGSGIIGALTIYSSKPQFFTGEEIVLLNSLAEDLSLAIDSMNNEKLRLDAEEALRASSEEIRVLYNNSKVTNDLLQLFPKKFSRKEYLDAAVILIREWSGCRHAGMRIADEEGNIPYESCAGFTPEFLESESMISLKRDQCACTRVVAGTPEPQDRIALTSNGSFYSNNTLEFLKGLTDEQKTRFRGVCIRSGFTSVAVVPIRYRDKVIGAVHLADERKDMVPRRNVEFIEQLAFIIGEAVFRFGIEDELRMLNRDLECRVAERTAQLEDMNKELEAFSYSVSHDLRAPLRAIDGFSGAIEEKYTRLLDEEGKDYLRRVRGAVGKMAKLIEALLGLSRLTRRELHRVTLNLSSLVKAAVRDLQNSQRDRKAEVVIADGITATGDPVMLRVVVENLVGNAWKFTEKREAARIEFGVEQKEGKDVYFVRDNGAGFDMTYASKLFSAFQRLHAADEFPGLGIGLATVQRIIHRHGGRIWAEGELDKGATFYFTL